MDKASGVGNTHYNGFAQAQGDISNSEVAAGATNNWLSTNGSNDNAITIWLLQTEQKYLKNRLICCVDSCKNQANIMLMPCGHIRFCKEHGEGKQYTCKIDGRKVECTKEVILS